MRGLLMLLLLLLLGLPGCASLDTLGMNERCRDDYNSCLNSCPSAATPAPGELKNLRPDVAGCTFECNERAKQCR